MSDLFAGLAAVAVGTIIILGVAGGWMYALGYDATDNVIDDCRNFGAFMHDGHKYECRRIEEPHHAP